MIKRPKYFIDLWAKYPERLGIASRYALTLEAAVTARNATITEMVGLLKECLDALDEDPEEENWVDLISGIREAIRKAAVQRSRA